MPLNTELLSAIMAKMNAGTGVAVAADAIAIWQRLARKFGPLLGPGSVSVLFVRSLESNKAAFPWLPPGSEPGVAEPPFSALLVVLEERQPPEIIAATGALLDTYIDLLSTLIGAHLAFHFLRSEFADDGNHEKT